MSPLVHGQQLKHVTAAVTRKTGMDYPGMIISNGSLDRDKDHVNPKGGDFSALERGNLPLVWGHDYGEIPIGRVTRLWSDLSGNIHAEWKWLEHDSLADRVKNAWDQGIITASSIGFMPQDSRPNKHGGFDHLEWELLELSLVSVPSNREAVRQLKALGLMGEPRRYEREDDMIDIDDALAAQIPAMVDEAVTRALRGHSVAKRKNEIEIDDADLRRVLADLPAIVTAAFHAAVAEEVRMAMRRLQGKVD